MSDPARPDLDALAREFAMMADHRMSVTVPATTIMGLIYHARSLEARLATARQQVELLEADRESCKDAIAHLHQELAETRVFAFWDVRRERERCARWADAYAAFVREHHGESISDRDRGNAEGAEYMAAKIRALPDEPEPHEASVH